MSIAEDWYALAIRAKWNVPEVQAEILQVLMKMSEFGSEDLDDLEATVFGPRVECPHGCGTNNLPGAPTCWDCGETL